MENIALVTKKKGRVCIDFRDLLIDYVVKTHTGMKCGKKDQPGQRRAC